MKKKIFILIMALVLILPATICLGGCQAGEETKYNITVSSQNSSMGNVFGSGTYAENEMVVICAQAKEGYEFEKWSDGNTNAIRTVTVNQEYTLTAKFKIKESKYVLDSVNIFVEGIDAKVESIILQKLLIENQNGEIKIIDLTKGHHSSYYRGEDGLTIYNEDNSYSKQYTQYDFLTIYAERSENNVFTTIETVYARYETYEKYDDSVSSNGAGKSSFDMKSINPQNSSNLIEIPLHNATMYVKLNFIKI